MRVLLIFLFFYLNNSLADDHVYLELNCSTDLGDKSVLVLKQVPVDDSETWVDEVPFYGTVLFNNQLYFAEVKEKKIEMKVYLDENGEETFDDKGKLKEMVIIDRYKGTIASIWFNDDGSINRPLSFGGQCKKIVLKKQF